MSEVALYTCASRGPHGGSRGGGQIFSGGCIPRLLLVGRDDSGHPTLDCIPRFLHLGSACITISDSQFETLSRKGKSLKSHFPRLTKLPGQWLQSQANGSNVCRVLASIRTCGRCRQARRRRGRATGSTLGRTPASSCRTGQKVMSTSIRPLAQGVTYATRFFT